jgi:hypothetical protein
MSIPADDNGESEEIDPVHLADALEGSSDPEWRKSSLLPPRRRPKKSRLRIGTHAKKQRDDKSSCRRKNQDQVDSEEPQQIVVGERGRFTAHFSFSRNTAIASGIAKNEQRILNQLNSTNQNACHDGMGGSK